MIKQKFDINNLRPASPCSMAWENMSGDERTRFCESCKLSVYNVSEMTTEQVRVLFVKTGGNFCGRIYRRADGTVLTKDCPVGLRAYYKRTARFAGAALTAIISLVSIGFGQNKAKKPKVRTVDVASGITRSIAKIGTNMVEGTIADQNGAVIPSAKITLKNTETKRVLEKLTDENGHYVFFNIEPGTYDFRAESDYFGPATYSSVAISTGENINISAYLEVGATMGVIVCVPDRNIDMSSTGITYKVTRDRFPF